MKGYRELRAALLDKLGSSPQALSQRVKRRKDQGLSMTTQEATCVIAYDEGIPIDRYLDRDALGAIRHLQAQANSRSSPAPVANKRKSNSTTGPREIRFPGEFKATDPILPSKTLNEAVAMAKLYPLFYVLENSMRELIRRVMKAAHGEDWWDTQLTNAKLRKVRDTAAKRMKDETAKKSWHQRRGDHPIDYVQIEDLEQIIVSKFSSFKEVIDDREWFVQFMKELKPSRNVICHMNPLDSVNTNDIKVKVRRWENMIKAKLDKIPAV